MANQDDEIYLAIPAHEKEGHLSFIKGKVEVAKVLELNSKTFTTVYGKEIKYNWKIYKLLTMEEITKFDITVG